MDLRFTEAQEILKKASRDFLTTECPKTLVRELEKSEKGYSPELWKKMAELGWMALVIPEQYEGIGYTFQDLTVLLEEVGRNILPGPLIPTVISTFPILEAGTEEQKKEFLPKIASGGLIMTMALLEAEGTFDASGISVKATPKGDDFIINGTKLFVEMAHVANYIVCVTRTKDGDSPEKGITLFLVNSKTPGIHCEVIPTIGADKLCEVRFENVAVPKKNMLGKIDAGWPIVEMMLRKGSIAKCAESVGAMQTCIEMTVAYSKERVQYERPIGAFQALQHIMANMWTSMQTGRYLVYQAAWMESEGQPCAKEASLAKAYINEVYKDVGQWAIRLHGGIATSYDHDIPLYYRRSKAADTSFGSTDYHRELVAREIGLK
ncbi:MAG: acyl-CoA dehydrogenase family protein [Dehalococcoidia bacterium]|jgi:alkylation response protein AidB-like acyl-CoA dehydrogenase